MIRSRSVVGLVLLATAACATPRPGEPLSSTAWSGLVGLGEQVAFDHGCPVEQIRLIRRLGDTRTDAIDLDVCGAVRRYKPFGGPQSGLTWIDVTSLYPPTSLPPPLPPAPPPAEPAPGSAPMMQRER